MNLRKQKRTYESEQRLANESEQTNLINNYEQTNLNKSYKAQGRKPQPQTSKHLESEWVTESWAVYAHAHECLRAGGQGWDNCAAQSAHRLDLQGSGSAHADQTCSATKANLYMSRLRCDQSSHLQHWVNHGLPCLSEGRANRDVKQSCADLRTWWLSPVTG